MVGAYNGVSFDMPELFLERGIIGFPFGDRPFERLLSPAFLMAIGFSFPFHRQGALIKDTSFELSVEGAYGTIDGHLLPADQDIGCPTLSHLVLDIGLLFLRRNDFPSSAALLVFLVLLVKLEGCMT